MISRKAYWGLLLLLPCLIQLCSSCDAKAKEESKATVPPSPIFPTPPPEYTDPVLRANYIIEHVFDPYQTLDSSTFITDAVAEQFFVNYFALSQTANVQSRTKSFAKAFEKGADDFNSHLLTYADQYLYGVNSPVYNEDLYIQLMQVADSMSVLSEADKIVLADRYNIYLKNRPGHEATDFTYVSLDGKSKHLYGVKADHTLLVFYNPGCGVCRDVMRYINESPTFNTAVDNGLAILCISLVDDVEVWKDHIKETPSKAQVGRDNGEKINGQSLYDIKAYPTLYLLDKNKKVIMKDPRVTAVEEWLRNNQK